MNRSILGIGAIVLGGLLLFVFLVGGYAVSVVNRDADLRAAASAQQDTNKAVFDTVWKILKQKAGVVDKYKKDFQEIWPDLIAGRYSQGNGSLVQWVQERNPDFDSSLYKDLMASIEAERKEFLREQKYLRKIKQDHDQLRTRFPSGYVLRTFGNGEELAVTIVTSAETEGAFESGEENDIDLFPR